MWITKVIFTGPNGNKTTTIDESTTEEFAKMKFDREIVTWFSRLTGMKTDSVVYNHIGGTHEMDIKDRNCIMLSIINSFLFHSKNDKDHIASFFIMVYEE